MTEAPDLHPERARLTDLVGFCERRVARAAERLRAVEIETQDAARALEAATLRLADWIEANPDPQLELI